MRTWLAPMLTWSAVSCSPPISLNELGTDTTEAVDMSDTAAPMLPECQWQFEPPPAAVETLSQCTHLLPGGSAAPVVIQVTNSGTDTVYIAGPRACVDRYFKIADPAGSEFPTDCAWPCEQSLQGECGCIIPCPRAPTVALAPGGTFEFEWEGWLYEELEISEVCGGRCAGSCNRRFVPPPGPLFVTLAVHEDLECDYPCECVPNPSGWCEINEIPLTPVTPLEFELSWPPPCPRIELTVP